MPRNEEENKKMSRIISGTRGHIHVATPECLTYPIAVFKARIAYICLFLSHSNHSLAYSMNLCSGQGTCIARSHQRPLCRALRGRL